jgi:hypothetical protein
MFLLYIIHGVLEMTAMRRADLLDHFGGVGGFLLLRNWVVGQLSIPRTYKRRVDSVF